MRALADFGVRTASALVIAVVFLGVLLFGGKWGLAAVVAVIAVLGAHELYRLSRREILIGTEPLGLAAVAVMPFAAAAWNAEGLTAAVAVFLACALAGQVLVRNSRLQVTAIVVFGALYVGFTLSHLVLLRELENGLLLAVVMVVSVWANDVLAYTVGSLLGRHPLAPRISPKKSWEGLVAGTVGTVGVWVASGALLELGLAWPVLVAIGLAASGAAVVGDLAESRIKREHHVKDSGTLLPGHGGYLDRFDSFLLVTIVTYYALLLAGAR